MVRIRSERALEDYIYYNPDTVLEGLSFFGRQVRLSNGIADLVGWHQYDAGTSTTFADIVVIELKAGMAGGKELAQVLRYCLDVETEISCPPARTSYRSCEWEARPILIAGGFKREVYAPAAYTNTRLFRWEEHDKRVTFTPEDPWRSIHSIGLDRHCPIWLHSLFQQVRAWEDATADDDVSD